MVFCLVALPVLVLLSVFSVKYRSLAKESLACVLKKISFRPCEADTEDRLKKEVFGSLLRFHKPSAFLFLKHFELVSLLLFLLFLASLALTGWGFYNFLAFGDCNGPNAPPGSFCVFNLVASETCRVTSLLDAPSTENAHYTGNPAASLTLLELGCYLCPYTKQSEADLNELFAEFPGKFQVAFLSVPLPNHPYSFDTILAAECAGDQNQYPGMRARLFSEQEKCSADGTIHFSKIAQDLKLDLNQFQACMDSNKYAWKAQTLLEEAQRVGLCGTPTFWIDGKTLVAPDKSELRKAIVEAISHS